MIVFLNGKIIQYSALFEMVSFKLNRRTPRMLISGLLDVFLTLICHAFSITAITVSTAS